MERRTAALLGVAVLFAIGGGSLAVRALSSFDESPTARVSSSSPDAPVDAPAEDPSFPGTREAIADLEEDVSIHRAFVAVGPGDFTVWKDHDGTFRTATGAMLCDRCVTLDFVVTRDRVVWLDLLETEVPGFNSSVRAFSVPSGWKRPDGGWLAGDRVCALNNASLMATDGRDVYVVDGKDDDAGVGYGQSVVRVDLAKGTTTLLAKTEAPIRRIVFASGELFVTWAAPPLWRVQAISTKDGAVRDVVSFTFQLPEETASSTELYFSYRDGFSRTSRHHLASVPLAGGPITTIYDAAPGEIIGPVAADDSGLHAVRFVGHWALTRFAKGAPPSDLAQFDATPRAIAPRKAVIAVAFLDHLELVPKSRAR